MALCIVVGIALGQWLPDVFQAIGRLEVALNDSIMVVAFAPLVAFLQGLSSITMPWDTLLISVALYIVIPVILAQLLRKSLLQKGQAAFDATMEKIDPWSITALLATLVLLFAFQGEAILKQPLVFALLAVPILVQVAFNSGLAYFLNRAVGEKHAIACPSALIGASNFFELAVAAAISLFGFNSGAALATVVGVLIEVPVMLLVVNIVNRSKGGTSKVQLPTTQEQKYDQHYDLSQPRLRHLPQHPGPDATVQSVRVLKETQEEPLG